MNYLRIQCGAYQLLFDIESVSEVGDVKQQDCDKGSNSKNDFRDWRGKALQVIDLNNVFASDRSSTRHQVVVRRQEVKQKNGDKEFLILDADKAMGIVEIADDQFGTIGGLNSGLDKYMTGVWFDTNTRNFVFRIADPFAWSA